MNIFILDEDTKEIKLMQDCELPEVLLESKIKLPAAVNKVLILGGCQEAPRGEVQCNDLYYRVIRRRFRDSGVTVKFVLKNQSDRKGVKEAIESNSFDFVIYRIRTVEMMEWLRMFDIERIWRPLSAVNTLLGLAAGTLDRAIFRKESEIAEIKDLCDKFGAKLIVVNVVPNFKFFFKSRIDSIAQKINQFMVGVSPVINLPRDSVYLQDPYHLSIVGHRMLANEICMKMEKFD